MVDALVRSESEGGHRAGKIFLVVPLHFLALKDSKRTISRFSERFRDGQYSLVSFFRLLFFYSQCPRAQAFVKVGKALKGHVPPAPWSRRHCPCAVSLLDVLRGIETLRKVSFR